MSPETSIPTESTPSAFNYILSFVLVGVAWGFTTPFIRRAAADFNARQDLKSGGAQDDDQARGQASGVSGEKEYTDEQGIRKRRTGQTAQGTAENDGLAPKESQPFWIQAKIVSLFWTVVNLLRTPAYSVPLVLNLTGSVWFFLLVGKHELSLTVPIANSSAFLFTVLGEWYVERKVIAKETWLGMFLVLGGIAVCVHSKNQTG